MNLFYKDAKLSNAFDSSSFDPFDLHFGSLNDTDERIYGKRLVSEEEYEVPNERLPEILDGSNIEEEEEESDNEYEFKRVPKNSKYYA
jgi:hypothetical protein